MIHRLRDFWTILKKNPQTFASIASGYLWAACLAAPGDTLARPTYRHMAEVMDEDAWVLLFFVVASLQMWRLAAKSTLRTFYGELCVKLFAFCLWTFVAIACLSAQWPLAAAMSDSIVIALLAGWDALRLHPCRGCEHSTHCSDLGCWYDR